MEKAFIVFFITVIILASERAGTAIGEAKIITNRVQPYIESHIISLAYITCSFTTFQGVRYTKDDYYGR